MPGSLLRRVVVFLLLLLVMLDTAFGLSVQEIVSNFREKYEKRSSFSADFEQTTIVAGRKRVAIGTLNFQKPNLLRQKYLQEDCHRPCRTTIK